MKRIIFIYAVIVFFIVSCNESSKRNTDRTDASLTDEAPAVEKPQVVDTAFTSNCKEGESLVYETKTFASYTEDKMRGQGIVSFNLGINDRLDILNEDDTKFGEIVLNEDMTYFTLTMPKKIVARKVITNYDFASFDFDAQGLDSDKDYLLIYINHEIKKVKKSSIKFTYMSWIDYIKIQHIKLKDCNLLTDASGKVNLKSKGFTFSVNEVSGDFIKIKPTDDCDNDKVLENLEGKIKWKSRGFLTVDFGICN